MAKVEEQVVTNFKQLLDELPTIIEAHKLDKTFLAEKSGLSRSTFYRKLLKKTFTVEEALKVVQAINL